ncbi:homoserine kinase [Piedraia hortae CBS 480.64]|uniref:Phosphoribosylformylglycinamidine cyclo-ligase n=1 Tax=Piedraia hortae CBS 480.64 TaxID=1314780 RepID=A0A6A7C0C9_9PEZI|nr:homoserine kinase [Piedraia hortae CBS 480.64]
MITIKVPCSSANIGPGFDVIGLALSSYLTLTVTRDESASTLPDKCLITTQSGESDIPTLPSENLITRVALYVLRCHGIHTFPYPLHLLIRNEIRLGRGLGSSGAAVVAGVALANSVATLALSRERMLDYCLMVERHPDNVAAALYGGFVGSYLRELDPEGLRRKEIPLAEVLPSPQGGEDTGLQPPVPPKDIAKHIRFPWAREIKCIAVIPEFEVSTATARSVLPQTYAKRDVVYNLQRVALLTTALGQSPPNAELIYAGMQDRLHQPYRKGLIPGLEGVLKSVTPASHPGLLGICLSGAGPTILALATRNFNIIAKHLIGEFAKEGVRCSWRLLEPAYEGLTVSGEAKTVRYADAGVSIDKGNEFVQRIKPLVGSTKREGADAEIGGFGGAFDLASAGYNAPPTIVQAIDGVGTKLKIAVAVGELGTIGVDLVAMNVNDLVVQGAEPLTFMDYYSTSRLDVETGIKFLEGVAKGCKEAGCALVGGETAEMPGIYATGDFDAAGAATGAVERGKPLLPLKGRMKEGNVLVGLPSSGPHSNGYSLIRKLVEGLDYFQPAPWDTRVKLGEALLTPTRIYVRTLLPLVKRNLVLGMAHITGGGLEDNVPRMLPDHLGAELDATKWSVPESLKWLKKEGALDHKEFARTWNTGLGMVLVVEEGEVDEVLKLCEDARVVGKVVDGKGVKITGTEVWD